MVNKELPALIVWMLIHYLELFIHASMAQNKGGYIPSDISSDFKQELKYRVQFGQACANT